MEPPEGEHHSRVEVKGSIFILALYDAYDGIDFNARSYFRERIVRRGSGFWEGVVHVFNLEGHPKATRAYAWSSPMEGSDKRRFYLLPRSPTERQYGCQGFAASPHAEHSVWN